MKKKVNFFFQFCKFWIVPKPKILTHPISFYLKNDIIVKVKIRLRQANNADKT